MPKLNLDVTGETTTQDVHIPVDGSAVAQIQEIDLVTDMSRDINAMAAEVAFMEEPVTVHLHESTNPNDELYVFCAVNGDGAYPGNPWLKRGLDHVIKRKFVLNLLTAKTVSYTQPFKDQAGDQANTMRRHAALKYPFSVVHDSNPRGGAWLKQMMAGA